MATSKTNQILKDIQDEIALRVELKKIEDDYYTKLSRRTAVGAKQLEQSLEQYRIEKELKKLLKVQATSNNQLKKHLQKVIDQKKLELAISTKLAKSLSEQKKLIRQQGNEYRANIKMLNNYADKLTNVFISVSSELLKIDHEIKQTILGISLSSERAAQFRDNLNQAALYTSMIGVNAADLAKMQKTYADETGRALILSKENLIAVSNLAKGTLLGAEGASKIVGAFELIGYGARDTVSYFEDVVNSSQKIGINSDKVIKRISENFKRSQMYNFRNGVKGLAEMSKYSEKFKNDIGGTFSAMDKARTLEGAIEMAANLQVIGGQFASSDPFQLLHLSRNDPQRFQKMLNEMTKGVAQFNKTSGEFEVTSLNLDRLRMVAEATGQDFNNLVEQSKQFAKVSTIERSVLGLSPEDKELVTSLAEFNRKSMKWEIQGVGDINKLSKKQIELLRGEAKTLKERAEASITFDKQMVYLVDTLKSSLLPLLEGVNGALKIIQGLTSKLPNFLDGWGKYVIQAGFIATGLIGAAKMLVGASRLFGPLTAITSVLSNKSSNKNTKTTSNNIGSKGGKMSKLGSLAKGSTGALLGLSAAITSVGLAINLATNGIANMATAFEKLDSKKIDQLNVTLGILGITLATTVVGGIIALGKAGEFSAIGLGILAGSVFTIGAGIGLATAGIGALTAGIGYMFNSFSKFGDASFGKNIEVLTSNMSMITSLDYDDTKKTFGVISDVLSRESAMREFGNMINSLKGLDNINNPLSELKDLFSKPLRMEFDSKSVNLSLNVDVNLDGNTIYKESNIAKKVMLDFVDFKSGKNSPSIK
jgi:hypothetical protein